MKDPTHCLMEARRELVRQKQRNGLDYVEVGDFTGLLCKEHGDDPDAQNYLTVFFLGKLGDVQNGRIIKEWRLSAANFRVRGGERIKGIRVLEALIVRPDAKNEDDMVVLRLDKAGDFSCYTLEIVQAEAHAPAADEKPHPKCHCRPCPTHTELVEIEKHFDQRYRGVEFSFKANCPSTLDCVQPQVCVEPREPAPAFSYLAKDYASFRELILDRLALTMPEWKERRVPDAGIAVAEIMAFHADRLSYYQDAIAQEAYLNTARRRISVRRHARLVDYVLHEGCNARAWVCCDPAAVTILQPDQFDLRTAVSDDSTKPLVFEPITRQRSAMLEAGDFFDLRMFAWKIVHHAANDVSRRLSVALLKALYQWQREHGSEASLPKHLARQLIDELNARLLLDRSYHADDAAPGDLDRIAELNRTAFDAAHGKDCVPLHGIALFPEHRAISIYTWQNQDCCLEKGATECVLADTWDDVNTPATVVEINAGIIQKAEDKPGTNQKDDHICDFPPVGPPRARTLKLRAGDVLIFEEVLGPTTNNPADADKTHRCAVRLTHVEPVIDHLVKRPLLRVHWAVEDALPFSFCLSRIGSPPDCRWIDRISMARGNVVLVDHGETQSEEPLGCVERDEIVYRCRCVGVVDEISVRAKPFRPHLHEPDLTFAVPMFKAGPASKALTQDAWEAVPALDVESLPPIPDGSRPVLEWSKLEPATYDEAMEVTSMPSVANLLDAETQKRCRSGHVAEVPLTASSSKADRTAAAKAEQDREALLTSVRACLQRLPRHWNARPDLLSSGILDRHFVVEMDDDRRAWLRFGRDGLGTAPEAGECFRTRYRIGNGPQGNTGIDTIVDLCAKNGTLGDFTVSNRLPAIGGTSFESLNHAKQNAPFVFHRRQLRAITADDYARLAEKDARVQRASAELRWTGSRQCVRVAIDPLGRAEANAAILKDVRDALLPYRRIGHDLEVIAALYVPLELELRVCALPEALVGHVEAAVRDALTSGLHRDGTPGFFHPDRLTFGQHVRISQIIAAVQPLPGVMSVSVLKLSRFGGTCCSVLEEGFLKIGALEVARLDQDPNNPEHGTLKINMGGGR